MLGLFRKSAGLIFGAVAIEAAGELGSSIKKIAKGPQPTPGGGGGGAA